MTRRKLKISELQNTKTKDLQSFQKKGKYPIFPLSPLVKTSYKKFEDPQNDKKKIKDSRTSKYENRKLVKFT